MSMLLLLLLFIQTNIFFPLSFTLTLTQPTNCARNRSALFSAVECNQLERAKSILEQAKVNVNR